MDLLCVPFTLPTAQGTCLGLVRHSRDKRGDGSVHTGWWDSQSALQGPEFRCIDLVSPESQTLEDGSCRYQEGSLSSHSRAFLGLCWNTPLLVVFSCPTVCVQAWENPSTLAT